MNKIVSVTMDNGDFIRGYLLGRFYHDSLYIDIKCLNGYHALVWIPLIDTIKLGIQHGTKETFK